jgi:hypothetical protein
MYSTMGILLFNKILNGVLNKISTNICSIPKYYNSQPYHYPQY